MVPQGGQQLPTLWALVKTGALEHVAHLAIGIFLLCLLKLAKSIAFHGMDSDDIDNNLDDCDDYYDCGEDYDTDGCYNPSFTGNPPESNSDGYIPDCKITLESVNGNNQTFDCYSKGGSDFIYEDGQWKKINGTGTVKINNIQNKKV